MKSAAATICIALAALAAAAALVPGDGLAGPAPAGPLRAAAPLPAAAAAPAKAGISSEDIYETRISSNGPFIIRYRERYARMADEVEKILVSSSPEIAAETGLENIDTIVVYIAPDRASFDRLTQNTLPEWGEAFSNMRMMIMGISAEDVLRTPRPIKVVVKHELSHLYLSQRVGSAVCPTWFVEGLAMNQSREWTFSDEWNLAVSVWRGDLPDLEDLKGSFPRPASQAVAAYRLSYAAVRKLLEERPGDLITLTAFTRDLGDFDKAFLLTFGQSTTDFTLMFHLDIDKKYRVAGALMESAPYWSVLTILFIAAYIGKRVRSGRKVRQWESRGEGYPPGREG